MALDTSAPLKDIVEEYKGKNADELYGELGKVPFFMNEYNEGEENMQVEALRAMAYEGEPWEIAENFKQQGNECFKAKKYKDAVQFYTQAIDQHTEKQEINIACLGNRAQCNLELKNYRRCITDCTRVLDIDPRNTKAWYRSAKAFLAIDKVDEAAACCDRGLAVESTNEGLAFLRNQAANRQAKLAELAAAEQARQEAANQRDRVVELALRSRNIIRKYAPTNRDRSNPGNLQPQLEDPTDPTSHIIFPVLVLYPVAMSSDILQAVHETNTVSDVLEQLFSEPPAWAEQPQLYKPENIDVFAQTAAGGLAKVGHKTTIGKVFGTSNVVMVDNMARLYVVLKSETGGWLKTWNKDAQAKLLCD